MVNDNSSTLRLWLLEIFRTKDLWKFPRLMNPRYTVCERVGNKGGHYVIQEEVRALSPTMNAAERQCETQREQVKESEKGQGDQEKERGMGRRFIWYGGDLAATHNMRAMLNGSAPNGYETAHAHTSH